MHILLLLQIVIIQVYLCIHFRYQWLRTTIWPDCHSFHHGCWYPCVPAHHHTRRYSGRRWWNLHCYSICDHPLHRHTAKQYHCDYSGWWRQYVRQLRLQYTYTAWQGLPVLCTKIYLAIMQLVAVDVTSWKWLQLLVSQTKWAKNINFGSSSVV